MGLLTLYEELLRGSFSSPYKLGGDLNEAHCEIVHEISVSGFRKLTLQ